MLVVGEVVRTLVLFRFCCQLCRAQGQFLKLAILNFFEIVVDSSAASSRIELMGRWRFLEWFAFGFFEGLTGLGGFTRLRAWENYV